MQPWQKKLISKLTGNSDEITQKDIGEMAASIQRLTAGMRPSMKTRQAKKIIFKAWKSLYDKIVILPYYKWNHGNEVYRREVGIELRKKW